MDSKSEDMIGLLSFLNGSQDFINVMEPDLHVGTIGRWRGKIWRILHVASATRELDVRPVCGEPLTGQRIRRS